MANNVNQDPTYIANQKDPVAGQSDPVEGGQAAQTARQAPGQRLLSAKEREQRQLALGVTVPTKDEAMCQCTKVLHIAVYFDGTGNNLKEEMAKDTQYRALSNIAKLNEAHKDDGDRIRAFYIPGVGTPYPEIGDTGGIFGMGIGSGADKRIKKALELLDTEIKKVPSQQKLLLIDVAVFGFSRGAAQARAFMRDLAAKCTLVDGAYQYQSTPLRIAFAGLYDTVCSAYGNVVSAALSLSGGHNGWADGMKLPPMVEQSVHMNAAHEARIRFPLDSTRDDASYPDNTIEVWYPGMHSDVGGGYQFGSQGRENGISRFALNEMFDLAFRAGVLVDKLDNLPLRTREEFNTDKPELRTAFNAYVEAVTQKTGPMEVVQAGHMELFHRWLQHRLANHGSTPAEQRLKQQTQVVTRSQTNGVDEAPAAGTNQAVDANDPKSKAQAKEAADLAAKELGQLARENVKYRDDIEEIQTRSTKGLKLTLREQTILDAWNNATPLPAAVLDFFDRFSHDSIAGFQYDSSRLSDWRTIYFGETKYKPS